LMPRLCSTPASVRRSHARTRRSRPPALRRPLARVSASTPLVLVWRPGTGGVGSLGRAHPAHPDGPERQRNTAMASHAGSVGFTTSKAIAGRSRRGQRFRRRPAFCVAGHCLPWPLRCPRRQHPTVWVLTMPKAMPTRRLWFIPSPSLASVPPACPAEATSSRPWSQGVTPQPTAPHSCAANGSHLQGSSHFPHPGHPLAGRGGNQASEPDPHQSPSNGTVTSAGVTPAAPKTASPPRRRCCTPSCLRCRRTQRLGRRRPRNNADVLALARPTGCPNARADGPP
jgi:hypothetical protein